MIEFPKCKCGNDAVVTRRSGHYCMTCLAERNVVKSTTRTRKTRTGTMLTPEYAMGIAALPAMKVGGTRKPRLTDGQHHPCKVTKVDGTTYVLTTTRNARKIAKQNIAAIPAHKLTAADLKPILAD